MLVLNFHEGDKAYCLLPDGTEIEICVSTLRGGKVRLGFTAPRNISIARGKVVEGMRRLHDAKRDSNATPR